MVPENEVRNASINPIAWLDINYSKNIG
jgi:hypothetical protein